MAPFLIATLIVALCIYLGRRYFFSFLGWLYLSRVSLVGLAFLYGLPLAARGPGRALAIGAFDLHGASDPLGDFHLLLLGGSFALGVLLPLAAWATFITAALVLAYGARRARFDLAPPPEWLPGAMRFALGAAMLLNVWTLIAATDRADRGTAGTALIAGLVAGLAVVWIGEEMHRRRGEHTLGGNLYFLPHVGEKKRLQDAVADQTKHAPPADDGWSWLLRGYRKHDDHGTWEFMPGHKLAFRAGLTFLVVNIVIYFSQFNSENELTAMVYLLVLLTTAMLLLGGIAFFLDAYRLPFISVLVGWLILAGMAPKADHFYRIWPRDKERANLPPSHEERPLREARSDEVITPAQLLDEAGALGRPIIVVAIAGGGIQSSAWGARILTGLEEVVIDARKEKTFGADFPSFAASVQCISGVSGGSTGAMFFVAGYGPARLPAPRRRMEPGTNAKVDAAILPKIVAAAEASSLGQSVWGMAYPDLRRAWVPFGIRQDYRDRAEKMEIRWANNGVEHMQGFGDDLRRRTLTDWQTDVRQGLRPAIIFNSTMVETGKRICFSTAPTRAYSEGQREFVISALPPPDAVASGPTNSPEDAPAVSEMPAPDGPYRQLHPGADLRITTAARLSATFPVISPSARPLLAKNADDRAGIFEPAGKFAALVPGANGLRHAVDGGYYENSGLGALVLWLDDALTDMNLHRDRCKHWPRSILVIQLDGFPETPPQAGGPPQPADGSGRGTLFQMASPLTALYNVRGTGHTAATERAFSMLQQRWLLTQPPQAPAADTRGQSSASPAPAPATCEIQLVRFTIPILAHDPAKRPFWEPAWAEAKPDHPPLSWHLREVEKAEVENAWLAFRGEMTSVPFPAGKVKPPLAPSANKAPKDPGARPIETVLEFLRGAKPALDLTQATVPAAESTATNAAASPVGTEKP